MAWYSDEEYEYRQDVREKTITARSARYKRTHCGKGGAVKFPSDYLTTKERKAMNGELKVYNLNRPMKWATFKEVSADTKKEYIRMIRERFGAPDGYIAEMLGCSRRTLGLTLTDLGCNAGKGHGSPKWDREGFDAWCRGEELKEGVDGDAELTEPTEDIVEEVVENAPVEPVVDAGPENAPNDVVEDQIDIIVPESGQMTFRAPANRITEMIKGMLGNANVEMTVNWTVIKEE